MHNHTPANYQCPFCLLIRNIESEHTFSTISDFIYHDDTVAAFIGSHQWPNNPGNVIVIPKVHHENIYDLPVHFALPMHTLSRAIAIAMKDVWGCDGISTRQHNEPAGNQDVWHYHVHITPRYTNDHFYGTMHQRYLMPIQERAKLAMEISSKLDQKPTHTYL